MPFWWEETDQEQDRSGLEEQNTNPFLTGPGSSDPAPVGTVVPEVLGELVVNQTEWQLFLGALPAGMGARVASDPDHVADAYWKARHGGWPAEALILMAGELARTGTQIGGLVVRLRRLANTPAVAAVAVDVPAPRAPHTFEPDGQALSCVRCQLPWGNRAHTDRALAPPVDNHERWRPDERYRLTPEHLAARWRLVFTCGDDRSADQAEADMAALIATQNQPGLHAVPDF